MKTTNISFLLSLIAASALFGEDITIRDGTVFKNASITTTTAAYVTVVHDDGTARIKISDLPDELQKKYAFDPHRSNQEMIAENVDAQHRANAKNRELIIKQRKEKLDQLTETKWISVIQILDEGLLVQETVYTPQYGSYITEVTPARGINGDPPKPMKVQKTVQVGDKRSVGSVIYLKGWGAETVGNFRKCPMWKIGKYSYKTLLGESRTIDKYTTSRMEAEIHNFGPLP